MNIDKRMLSVLVISFVAVAGVLTIIASGGGDGDDSSGGANPPSVNSYDPAVYTGLTTLAEINASNAPEYVGLLMEGPSAPPVTAQSVSVQEQSSVGSVILGSINVWQGLSQKLVSSGAMNNTLVGITEGDYIYGSCGGKAYVLLNYDPPTSAPADFSFTGGFYYLNYCENDIVSGTSLTIDGYSSINGSAYFDGAMVYITSMTVNSEAIKQEINGQVLIVSGTVQIDTPLWSGTATLTTNSRFSDESSGVVYWYENVVMSATSTTATVTGNIYHPDYGKVVVTTDTALYFSYGDLYPSSGQLTLTGEQPVGATGPTKAVVIFSTGSYQIQIDDGNGNITTLTCPWGGVCT
jgi:hypothetical protein